MITRQTQGRIKGKELKANSTIDIEVMGLLTELAGILIGIDDMCITDLNTNIQRMKHIVGDLLGWANRNLENEKIQKID